MTLRARTAFLLLSSMIQEMVDLPDWNR